MVSRKLFLCVKSESNYVILVVNRILHPLSCDCHKRNLTNGVKVLVLYESSRVLLSKAVSVPTAP